MKLKKILLSLLLTLIICFIGIFLASKTLNQQDGILYYLKQLVPEKLKILIKKNFLAKNILENQLSDLKDQYEKFIEDDYILNISKVIELKEEFNIKSKNGINYSLKKIYLPFKTTEGHGGKPGGYLENYNNHLIIASGDANFISINMNQLENKEIKINSLDNNFNEIVKNKEFYTSGNYGLRDLKIIDNNIFLSYPKLIFDKKLNKQCFTLGILFAEINLDFLNFKEFFSLDQCAENGSWETTRSGGRIEGNKHKIFLTVGDFGDMIPTQVSQNIASPYGKIISIDRANTDSFRIISMGHRNQQGLLLDEKKNFLLSSEHGPNGGDEVNLINLNHKEIQNFGWPISSYGEHYPGTVKGHYDTATYPDLIKYAPLHKNHSEYGFIEPLINWTPSIGVSQIVLNEINDNKQIFVAAMGNNIPEGDRTIHEYIFSTEYKNILSYDKIVIGERIRDILLDEENQKLLMILESNSNLGILTKIN